MSIWILGSVVGIGLLFTIVMAISLRAVLRQKPKSGSIPVTILKPLKGVDPDLEANLRSIFDQEYGDNLEIILGTEDPDDPALEVVRKTLGRYPNHNVILTSSAAAIGYNPKINNLANIYSKASNRILVINDSNTRVPKNYIADLAGHLIEGEGALVWSPFRGTGERGLGGMLEALHLNTQVVAGMAAVTKVIGMPCALGKSMMFTSDQLEAIGGFEYLGQYLAEDQIMAEEMGKRHVQVRMSGVLIDNVLGYRSMKDYMSRQLRWARLRRSMKWLGYGGELLLNPTFIAFVGALCLRTVPAAMVFAGSLVWMGACEAWMERMVGVRRNVLLYPLLELMLSTCRGILWPLGFLSSYVNWRGNVLKVGPRSQLQKTAPLKKPDKVHSVVG
jgi:ceramide glucosyltransferase